MITLNHLRRWSHILSLSPLNCLQNLQILSKSTCTLIHTIRNIKTKWITNEQLKGNQVKKEIKTNQNQNLKPTLLWYRNYGASHQTSWLSRSSSWLSTPQVNWIYSSSLISFLMLQTWAGKDTLCKTAKFVFRSNISAIKFSSHATISVLAWSSTYASSTSG